jgi:hypothetical protein
VTATEPQRDGSTVDEVSGEPRERNAPGLLGALNGTGTLQGEFVKQRLAQLRVRGWAGVIAALVIVLGGFVATGYFADAALAGPVISAPKVINGPTNPSTNTSPEFTLTDANYPNVTFACDLDSGPVMNCTGDTDHDGDTNVQGEWQFKNLAPGPHCFYVWAINKAKNISPTTTFCWTISSSSNFTISGNIVPAFYPGLSQQLDLVFTNPNASPITIAAGGVTITIATSRSGCLSSPNFAVTHGLTATVTIPKNSTKSLLQLGIATAKWPVITMLDPNTNQDVCAGMALTFHYSAVAT